MNYKKVTALAAIMAFQSSVLAAADRVTFCNVQSDWTALHIISVVHDDDGPPEEATLAEIIDGEATNYTCKKDYSYCTTILKDWQEGNVVALELDFGRSTVVETYTPFDPEQGPGYRAEYSMTCETRDLPS